MFEQNSYIHGGAWRDPLLDKTSIRPAIPYLLKSEVISERVAAIASINYRLSSYSSHSTSPSKPEDESRNATHPDHVNDVLRAVRYLQDKYNFGRRWIVVGHSAGATLAFQVALKIRSEEPSRSAESIAISPPISVLGISGIYYIPTFAPSYGNNPVYAEIVRNAYGDDLDIWRKASPVSADFTIDWPKETRFVILVRSLADEMVESNQFESMLSTLQAAGWTSPGSSNVTNHAGNTVVSMEIEGNHDSIWQKGTPLAAVIVQAVSFVD